MEKIILGNPPIIILNNPNFSIQLKGNFQTMCRICLIAIGATIPLVEPDLIELIQQCAPVQEEIQKKLPQQVCPFCHSQLKNLHNFMQQCRKATNILTDMILENKNEQFKVNKYGNFRKIAAKKSNIVNKSNDFEKFETFKEETKEIDSFPINNNLNDTSDNPIDGCSVQNNKNAKNENHLKINKIKVEKENVSNESNDFVKFESPKKETKEIDSFPINDNLNDTSNNLIDRCSVQNNKNVIKVENENVSNESNGLVKFESIKEKTEAETDSFTIDNNGNDTSDDSVENNAGSEQNKSNVQNKNAYCELKKLLLSDKNTPQSTASKKSTKSRATKILKKLNGHHNGPKSHKCNECNAVFRYPSHLQAHQSKHTNEKPYECNRCNRRYKTKGSLDIHVSVKHEDPEKVEKAQCHICGKILHIYHIQAHISYRHPLKNPLTCEKCDKKFTHKGSYYSHMVTIHRSVKLKKCPYCPREFRTYSGRIGHINRRHKQIGKYKCTTCDVKFHKPCLLKEHMERVHFNIRPHECELCGEGFYTKNVLKNHMITHTGERSHLCTVCGQAFGYSNVLKTHIKLKHEKDKKKDT